MDTFEQIMKDKVDEELIKIATIERDSYQKLAVQAAEFEINNRGLAEDYIDEIKVKLTVEKSILEDVNSNKASLIKRILNFVIDTTIVAFSMYFIYSICSELPNTLLKLILLTYFGYYIHMEHRYQKTIGKYVTKTKVVNIYGQKAKFSQIIQRSFCRILPFDPFTFFFPKKDMEFHDVFTQTKVINDYKNTHPK